MTMSAIRVRSVKAGGYTRGLGPVLIQYEQRLTP